MQYRIYTGAFSPQNTERSLKGVVPKTIRSPNLNRTSAIYTNARRRYRRTSNSGLRYAEIQTNGIFASKFENESCSVCIYRVKYQWITVDGVNLLHILLISFPAYVYCFKRSLVGLTLCHWQWTETFGARLSWEEMPSEDFRPQRNYGFGSLEIFPFPFFDIDSLICSHSNLTETSPHFELDLPNSICECRCKLLSMLGL